MRNNIFRSAGTSLVFFVVIVAVLSPAFGQQQPDPNFDAKVSRPAYTKRHPKVLIDQAHNNFHTADGRYKPFADLVTNDGYEVIPNKEKFSIATLKSCDILVIANAAGERGNRANPAFTEEECDAVRDWVRAGGSLLLITDHYPYGPAAEILAKRFGVEMSKGFTEDVANYDKASGDESQLVYTRERGLLINHPIIKGRNKAELISRVMTFTGQSLKSAQGQAFLSLSATAMDRVPKALKVEQTADGTRTTVEYSDPIAAAGRAQAIALKFGKGRVVVTGEAAMLTAQLNVRDQTPFGMNVPGTDNRQLALNIMHWLSRLLK
jgi:hypothetical protein